MNTNELYHYGILGMKWGVRRYRNYDGTLTSAGKKKYSKSNKVDSVKTARKAALKNRKKMSDQDIDKLINRIKKEKELKNLIEEDLSPGRYAVKQILSATGKKVLTTALTGATIYGIKYAIGGEFNAKEAADTIARGALKKK